MNTSHNVIYLSVTFIAKVNDKLRTFQVEMEKDGESYAVHFLSYSNFLSYTLL